MNSIEKDLLNHKCKDCNNLSYWDWYYCKLGKHQTKKGFLRKSKLKQCESFIERQGKAYPGCKEIKCIFWCIECPAADISK